MLRIPKLDTYDSDTAIRHLCFRHRNSILRLWISQFLQLQLVVFRLQFLGAQQLRLGVFRIQFFIPSLAEVPPEQTLLNSKKTSVQEKS